MKLSNRNLNMHEVYVLQQPKHHIFSLIVVDDVKSALPQKIHDAILRLAEISDIGFVFNFKKFPNSKNIDIAKFSSLYEAKCLIVGDDDYMSLDIMKMLSYCINIFDSTIVHSGFTISRLEDMALLTDVDFNNLSLINGSTIVRPIYKSRRLTSSEYWRIYSTDFIEEKSSFRKIFDRIVQKVVPSFGIIGSNCRKFSRWHTDSPILYYRKPTISSMLGTNTEDLKTFIELDPRYMFASLDKMMGNPCLNMNFSEVSI